MRILRNLTPNMKTDYKISYIKRADDIHISECAVRFFEGKIEDRSERDPLTDEEKTVQRYARTKDLGSKVFTAEHFGKISTDEELKAFLNKELAKDKKRTPIKEQI